MPKNINELIFGPMDKSKPKSEEMGSGITTRWFDKIMSPLFDADEGVDDQLLGMAGWQEKH